MLGAGSELSLAIGCASARAPDADSTPMVRITLVLILVAGGLMGCDEPARSEAAIARPYAASSETIAAQSTGLIGIAAIRGASFDTSPPTHPSLSWPQLAPRIESARQRLREMPALERPRPSTRPLAQRATSEQFAHIAEARERAVVLRAEAARRVASGYPDAAVDELIDLLGVSRSLASWGVPAAAEASAQVIDMALTAIEQPRAARLAAAWSPEARSRMLHELELLDLTDPAGRLRAIVESASSRTDALSELSQGRDGPSAVRSTASRYHRAAELGRAKDIERLLDESRAFAMALADGWDRPTRSAITERLRQRQTEDTTGVLEVVLGEAADACDADVLLRERIERSIEALR